MQKKPVPASAYGSLDNDNSSSSFLQNNYSVNSSQCSPMQACQMCHRKKVRCELQGSSPVCIQCMHHNTRCDFDAKDQRRNSLKRKQYIRSLEERLRRTEALLKAAGILNEDTIDHNESFYEGDYDDDDDNEQSVGDSDIIIEDDELQEGTSFSPANKFKKNARVLRHSDRSQTPASTRFATAQSKRNSKGLSSSNTPSSYESRRSSSAGWDLQHVPLIKMDNREDLRYYGKSSSLSILSREGVEWIKSKAGDASFLNVIFSDSFRDRPWDHWRPDVFHDLFASKVFKPLPPRAEVFSLLRDYFRTVNRLFPLYHEATFMRLVEWQYTQQTCDDAARWASINIILSLAYEYRFSNSLKPEKDRERAWLYFNNALSVFTELTFRRTDLLSVQALLGMAMFLRGNSGTQSASPIITAALGSCHRMGLHRDISRPGLSTIEEEQRRRVFWIAYILDQSTCIRLGNAPLQHPDDVDVEFPQHLADEEASPQNAVCIDFFHQLSRLTLIKGQIYFNLYSTSSLQRSPAEVCESVRELNAKLEEWINDYPFNDQVKPKPGAPDFLLGFASIALRLVYYNCLIMIHRMPPLLNTALARNPVLRPNAHFDQRSFNIQSSTSNAVCLQAARDSLKLVNNMPWGDIAWIWSLLYYVFHAVMAIFVNILRNSSLQEAREDLHSLTMATTFFATLKPADGPCSYASFMTEMAANFERIARVVVEKNEKEIRNNKGGTNNNSATMPSRKHSRKASTPLQGRVARRQRSSPPPPPTTNMEISNVEGLPPINSAGYVVPESPTDSTPVDPVFSNDSFPVTQGTSPLTSATSTAAAVDQGNVPRNFSSPLANTIFPFPTTVPGFWQIPLTADWELGFGNQFPAGNFLYSTAQNFQQPPQPYSYPQQYPLSTMGTTTTTTTMSMSPQQPCPPDMGFYNTNNNFTGGVQMAMPPDDPLTGRNVVWTDGFLDSY